MTELAVAAPAPGAARALFPGAARLRRRRRGVDLPVRALRRAGDAVRAAARHGDELPLGRRARARPASSSPRARCCASASRCSACASRIGQIAALGWGPVRLVVVSVIADDRRVDAARAADGIPVAVRPAERRRDRDLRRLGGARAGRGAAGPSAEGARDAVHRRRRLGAVDLVDDRLPDDRARARPRQPRRRRLPRRDHPRRRAGRRRRLQHVARDRRHRHLRQADARGDAACR